MYGQINFNQELKKIPQKVQIKCSKKIYSRV